MGIDLTAKLANAAANRRGSSPADSTPADPAPAAPAPAAPAPAAKTSRREVPAPAADALPTSALVADIAFNPFNRRVISLANPETAREIKELAASLKKGQISPIAVISRAKWNEVYGSEHADKIGDAKWVQIPGGRRLTAAREHGIKALDIVVKDNLADRENMLAMTAIENLQRLDLSPLEEAEQIEDLRIAVGGKAATVANRLSRPASYISQRLDLLRLCDPLRAELRAETMTLADARELVVRIKAEIKATTGVARPEPGVTIAEDRQLALWAELKAEREAPAPIEPEPAPAAEKPAKTSKAADQGDDPAAAGEALTGRVNGSMTAADLATVFGTVGISRELIAEALALMVDADQADDFADADASSENEGL